MMCLELDSYFCFCCLSTDDLNNMFSNETNYGNMLKDICGYKPSHHDYEDDGYICSECTKIVQDVYHFKVKVSQSLHMLQQKGLVKLRKMKDYTLIKKVSVSDKVECKREMEDNKEYINKVYTFVDDFDNGSGYGDEDQKDSSIKREVTDQSNADNSTVDNVDLITRTFKLLVGADYIDQNPIVEEKVNKKNYPCSHCNEVFTNANTFKSHKHRKHNDVDRIKRITVTKRRNRSPESSVIVAQTQTAYEVSEDLKCQLCGKQMPNVPVFHAHMNAHYPNHVCDKCGKGFLNLRRLTKHAQTHEKISLSCDVCNKVYTSYNSLNYHKKLNHRKVKTMYQCPQCGERFRTYNRRMQHLAQVHALDLHKYKCTMCPREFTISGNLSGHIRRTHLKVKRHFCSECDLGFYKKSELSSHMFTHTGVKDYECAVCSKRLLSKKTLAVHMRIHNNDKRFACDECGKRFVQKIALQSHLKVHGKEIGLKEYKAVPPNLILGTDIDCYSYI